MAAIRRIWHISTITIVWLMRDVKAQVEANGFLYKMVRHLTGALLTVGRSKLSVEAIQVALNKGTFPGETRLAHRGIDGLRCMCLQGLGCCVFTHHLSLAARLFIDVLLGGTGLPVTGDGAHPNME